MSQTKLVQWGNSKAVRIPIEIIKHLDLQVQQNFEVTTNNQSIILTPINNLPETIEELFAEYDISKPISQTELDWGPPQGEEIW